MSKYYVNYQYIHNKNYNVYNGYKFDKFPFYTGKNKVHMQFKFNNDYKRYISTLTLQDEILIKNKNKENIEFKQLVENEYNVISLDKKNDKNQKENTNKENTNKENTNKENLENLENNEENSLLQQTSLLTKLWYNLPTFSYWK